jgi:multimeric flavodoxin WrbA
MVPKHYDPEGGPTMAAENTFQVLGISCSPRKGGNTDVLVTEVLTAAREGDATIEFLRVAEMEIHPCDACWSCAETGQCHIQDDMQKIYPRLLSAQGIVIGSPTHMGYNVSGQAQVFFDRTFALWHQRQLQNKVGASVAASNRRGGINVINVINNILFNHHMVIAGFVSGYGRNPGDIRRDEKAWPEAGALGKRLGELITAVRL